MSFGPGCVLDRGLTVECYGRLTVGAGTVFGHHCTLGVKESLQIGSHCLIADMVSIRDSDHVFDDPDRPYVQQGHRTAPVVLEDNVWLGSKVVVARGVRIGLGLHYWSGRCGDARHPGKVRCRGRARSGYSSAVSVSRGRTQEFRP